MISFFRKIRIRLLQENRFTRYLIYAIGEIILVVIGIVIGLQVSNWNEIRKDEIKTELLIDKIEQDLMLTIRNANHDINNVHNMAPNYTSYFEANGADFEANWAEIKTLYGLKRLASWKFTLDPTLNNLYKLVDKQENLTKKYDEIINDINNMEFVIGRERDEVKSLKESANKNLEYLFENYHWMRKNDSLSIQEGKDYFLDDNSKNKIYAHYIQILNYTSVIVRFRSEAMILLLKLKKLRKDTNSNEIKKLMDTLDFRQFQKIDCNYKNVNNPPDAVDRIPIFINISDKNKNLKIEIRNGEYLDYQLNPGEISEFSPFAYRFGNEIPLRIVKVFNDSLCVESYREISNGYLLLE